jgi:hypothetical protein
MKTRETRHPDEGVRHINPIRARLLQIWGPAESWDNPLMGTRYDPNLRRRRDARRRHEREARHEERRNAKRATRAEGASEHYTPDDV